MALPSNEFGGLGTILLQMSPSFHNTGNSFEVLSRSSICPEVRHKSWHNDNHHLLKDAVKLLRDNHIAEVIVDGPGFPYTRDLKADPAYVRYHGRNFDVRYHDEKEDDVRIDRYGYLYPEEQMAPWVLRIKEMEDKVSRVRVFFNNHGRAKSAKSASS